MVKIFLDESDTYDTLDDTADRTGHCESSSLGHRGGFPDLALVFYHPSFERSDVSKLVTNSKLTDVDVTEDCSFFSPEGDHGNAGTASMESRGSESVKIFRRFTETADAGKSLVVDDNVW